MTINHHLILSKREWTAVINAVDALDVLLHKDEPIQDFVLDDMKQLFPSGFLDELSNKIATSK
jgi:hypothetical protein